MRGTRMRVWALRLRCHERLHLASVVVSVQAANLPSSLPSPPDRSRGLSRFSANLLDLGL